MELHLDDEDMLVEVKRFLSLGMPIDNAKRIMQQNGFQCQERNHGAAQLNCWAVYKTHFLRSDEIHILLSHESGLLNEIKVECYSVGP